MSSTDARILHIVDRIDVGGMERNLFEIVRATRDDFEHHVCCLRGASKLEDEFVGIGALVHHQATSGRGAFAAIAGLTRLVRQLRPAIVHARNWGTAEAVPAARIGGTRAVVYGEHGRRSVPRLRRREWGRWLLAPFVDAIVAPSDDVRAYLTDEVGIAAGRIRVIRNGVDTDRFRPVADRAALRARLGIEPDAEVVVALGRMKESKNLPVLVAALERLSRKRPRLSLVLVGDGEDRVRVERTARELGVAKRMRLTGMRDDVEHWLAAADVLAHTSRSEGSSNAILQGMACGLPVVATDLGANAEIVDPGETATLVPVGDVAAVAAAIAGYLADDARRRQHGNAARHRVLSRYPLHGMTEGYRKLYSELAYGHT